MMTLGRRSVHIEVTDGSQITGVSYARVYQASDARALPPALRSHSAGFQAKHLVHDVSIVFCAVLPLTTLEAPRHTNLDSSAVGAVIT
jgi:hypothetical protein